MRKLAVFGLSFFVLSCSKSELQCIAKDAHGNEMYKVVGDEVCEDQISKENGEYCECTLME